jgi:polyisoprenoid-binding protein YceI
MLKLSLLALAAAFPFIVPTTHRAPVGARYIVAPSGNEARYRVREQLMHHDLPNDAIGKTTAISGGITIAKDGSIDTAASKITIDVTSLKSDKDRRDGYVQHRILETAEYPTVVFTPTELRGVKLPPSSAAQSFDVSGLLTVHGVTRPTVWHVTAQSKDADLTGTGRTQFSFEDMSLSQPHVPVVLSVADTITLEYDFHLVRQP